MRSCPKCFTMLEFVILVEDTDEKVFKNLYYCPMCKMHVFKKSPFSEYIIDKKDDEEMSQHKISKKRNDMPN